MINLSFLLLVLAAVVYAQRFPLQAHSTDQQILAIERHLKASPDDAAIRDELAGAYLQKMRETGDGAYLKRAEYLIQTTLRQDANNYPARRRQIEVEMQRHHFKGTVEHATALLKDHAGDSAMLALLGDALMELGDYDRAADIYQKLVDIRPALPSYNRIAWFRFVTGDAEGAVDMAKQAIRLGASTPENLAWCHVDLGSMLLKTGATVAAEGQYQAALKVFPGYHPALAGLGRVMIARDRLTEAAGLLKQAQARVPSPEYAGLLATIYRKTGQLSLADAQIAMLDATDKLERAAGEQANRNLALAYADLGYRTSRAVELARAELSVRQDVYTWDALAWALFRDGKVDEAATAIPKALTQKTSEPSFYEHAARIRSAAAGKDLASTQ